VAGVDGGRPGLRDVGDTKDPGYQTTITPDNEATEYKTDFTAAWNPIAAQYGLTTYQQGQL
jgi:hypothetical protein